MKRDTLLWIAIFAGPVIWMISFAARFSLTPWVCSKQWKPGLYLITILAVVIAVGSAGLAWAEWKQLGEEWPGQQGTSLARSRMMAISGVLLSSLSALLILSQGLADIVLGACE
jgi:hypothetical protein